jgi:CHAT domain-containing protein/tetratricopeptide (TPR) repeat protein
MTRRGLASLALTGALLGATSPPSDAAPPAGHPTRPGRSPQAAKPTRSAKPAPTSAAVDAAAVAAARARLDAAYHDAQRTQAFFAAHKTARARYELDRRVDGDDAVTTIRAKEQLAITTLQIGDRPAAGALFRELLATAERLHGPTSREVMAPLQSLLGLASSLGDGEEAERLQLRILDLTRQLDGAQGAAYAAQLSQHARVLTSRGAYAAALQREREALALIEAAHPPPDQLISPVTAVANAYLATDDVTGARPYYQRALALADQAPDQRMSVALRTVFSGQLFAHHRDDLAAPLRAEAVASLEANLARPASAQPAALVSGTWGQLGGLYRQAGDLARAEQAWRHAVDADPVNGPLWLPALAELKRARGAPAEALALIDEAQARLDALRSTSAAAFDLTGAELLRQVGRHAEAERRLARYQRWVSQTVGAAAARGSVGYVAALIHLGAGHLDQAERDLGLSLDEAERRLGALLRRGTGDDQVLSLARDGYQIDLALAFHLHAAPTRPSAARLALTTILRRKGRGLDAAATSVASVRARLDPADQQLLADLESARGQLATLTIAGPIATGPAEFPREVAALELTIQRLEVELGRRSASYRLASQPIDVASVQRVIPRDARLIELVDYVPYDLRTATYAPTAAPPDRHYAAYVLGPTGDPRAIDLGPAATIDALVEEFRIAIADPRSTQVAAVGAQLDARVFAPLTPLLGGATRLLLAPDGALNLVAFGALVDAHGSYRVDRYTITYLTSGRDLLRWTAKAAAKGGPAIFADPAFGASAPAPAGPRAAVAGGVGIGDLAWPPLPGTAKEADAIAALLDHPSVYRGAQATEAALKALHGPRLLHLATHGFFLPDATPAPTPPPTTSLFGLTPAVGTSTAATAPTPAAPAANPLLRSGLALAGANALRSGGGDDGILTALEAAGLDLTGTRLVVLSACQTGVGKVTNGDGVYGLRRALVIAGAESLVMSLWQVDDDATQALMTGFYQRLERGAGRGPALRDAQRALAADPRYAHPYYWAGFLPTGDDRPLK